MSKARKVAKYLVVVHNYYNTEVFQDLTKLVDDFIEGLISLCILELLLIFSCRLFCSPPRSRDFGRSDTGSVVQKYRWHNAARVHGARW